MLRSDKIPFEFQKVGANWLGHRRDTGIQFARGYSGCLALAIGKRRADASSTHTHPSLPRILSPEDLLFFGSVDR